MKKELFDDLVDAYIFLRLNNDPSVVSGETVYEENLDESFNNEINCLT